MQSILKGTRGARRQISQAVAGAEASAAIMAATTLTCAVSTLSSVLDGLVCDMICEEVDNRAANRLAEKLGGAPTFSSSQYNIYQLVSLFRVADLMLSSRYHAIVTSMAGRVASAGITFYERIANLMRERGHEYLSMRVDDPNLEPRIDLALQLLNRHADQIAEECVQTVARQLSVMSGMGKSLLEHVLDKYPKFEPKRQFHSWEDYLPPLGRELHELIEQHSVAA